MAIVDYSILSIGLIIIPLSTDLTATISNGLSNRKSFSYQIVKNEGKPAILEVVDKDGNIITPSQKAVEPFSEIAVKGEDNITLTLTQSNNSVGNNLFTAINSILAVATGLSKAVDLYTSASSVKESINKASDLLSKQLTICSYFDLSGEGSFFNYRLIDFSFDKDLNAGTSTLAFTFSNYYNAELTSSDVEKINNITKV